MTRYRWMDAQWPISMRELAEGLKQNSFADGKNDGFIVERAKDNFVEARYIEKIEYTELMFDPFGKELTFNRVAFYQCEFRASSLFPGLELLNAPRGTGKMLSRLDKITDFSLSLSNINIDVLEWSSFIKKDPAFDTVVDLLQVANLELGHGVTAKAIVKGDRDVLNVIGELTEGKKHSVEKVQLRFYGEYEGTLLLTSGGAAKIDVSHSDEILKLLRNSLSSMKEWNHESKK